METSVLDADSNASTCLHLFALVCTRLHLFALPAIGNVAGRPEKNCTSGDDQMSLHKTMETLHVPAYRYAAVGPWGVIA